MTGFTAQVYYISLIGIDFFFILEHISFRGGAVGKSVRPISGRLGVRIPAATDLGNRKKQVVTAPMPNARQ